MSRPANKDYVSSEQRKEWLRRHEEKGDSPPQIAKEERYDVRTIRKHIELARQERETRETRLIILRGAVEGHYQDLCKFAERIDSSVAHGELTTSLITDRMYTALRQHMLRSLLWKHLDKWNSLHGTLTETRAGLRTALSEDISKDSPLNEAFHDGKEDISGMVEVFANQSEFWIRGSKGLEIERDFKMVPVESGLVNLRFGAYPIGTVAESQASLVKKALIDLRRRLPSFDEYQKLQQYTNQLEQIKPDIQEELAIIKLRRIVPGKCKYCPV